MATKVITGANTRWSYANVWEPKAMEGGKPKFSVSLIIPKSDSVTVGKIRAAIEEAYRDGQSKLKGNGKSVPALSTLRTPLRDGDLNVRMILPTPMLILSMPTQPQLPAWWMPTETKFSTSLRSTLVATAEPASASMHSMPMGTVVLPADSTICRRSGTENLWAARPVPRATSLPSLMKTF